MTLFPNSNSPELGESLAVMVCYGSVPPKVSTIPTHLGCMCGLQTPSCSSQCGGDGDVWVDAVVNLLLSSIDCSTKEKLV